MPGTRSQNTMVEGLRGFLSQIAELKAAPDADIAYLTNIETQVLKYLRAPFEKQQAEQQLGGQGGQQPPGPAESLLFPQAQGGGAGAGGGAGLAGLLAGIGGGGGQGQPVHGVMQAPQMPNGDELRRLMAQPSL